MSVFILQLLILTPMIATICDCTTIGKEYFIPFHKPKSNGFQYYTNEEVYINRTDIYEDSIDETVQLYSKGNVNPDTDHAGNIYSRLKIHFGEERSIIIHIKGDNDVAILIVIDNFETSTPISIAGFGQEYFIVNLGYRYKISFMSTRDRNKITFTIRSENKDFRMNVRGVNYGEGETWSMIAHGYYPYAVSNCDYDNRYVGSLTGSHMRGTYPFVVLSGNCLSPTDTNTCNNMTQNSTQNLISEMLYPAKYFGKTFLLFNMSMFKISGYYIIMAGSDDTNVKVVRNPDAKHESYILSGKGQWFTLEACDCYLTSNRGLQIMLVQRSGCIEINDQTPSMMPIVPMELFFYKYLFSIPIWSGDELAMIYIVESVHTDYIHFYRINNKPKQFKAVVYGNKHWQINAISDIDSDYFGIYSTRSYFGCYLIGRENLGGPSFMHNGDFMMAPINKPCKRSLEDMYRFDYIDNDCDGKIDEEMLNGIDDDNDSLVDEDLNSFSIDKNNYEKKYFEFLQRVPGPTQKTKPTTSGMSTTKSRPSHKTTTNGDTRDQTLKTEMCNIPFLWGINCSRSCKSCQQDCDKSNGSCNSCSPSYEDPEIGCTTPKNKYEPWTEWQCTHDCKETAMFRKRECSEKSNCPGLITMKRLGNCYIQSCPERCESFTWGMNCSRSCINCVADCNKFTGKCTWCKPGFKSPNNGCSEACGPYEFGINCRGDCRALCGHDCYERREGICEEPKYDIQMIAAAGTITAAVVAMIGYIYICCRGKGEDETINNANPEKEPEIKIHDQLDRKPSKSHSKQLSIRFKDLEDEASRSSKVTSTTYGALFGEDYMRSLGNTHV